MTILHDIKNVEHHVSDNPLVAHRAYGRRKSNKSSKSVHPFEFRNIAHARAFGGPHNITREILKVIRAAQPISRVAVAQRLGINRSTVTVLVNPLLDAGVLRECAVEQSIVGRTGRPPIGLSLCAKNEFFIGVNIGVRHIQIGAMTMGDRLLSEESFATPHEPTEALSRIRLAIEQICKMMPERRLEIIGISVPGPIDVERRRLLYAPHLGWRDVAIADLLGFGDADPNRWITDYKVPVIVENNATAAAIYEACRHRREERSRTSNDFILVQAGTGIGVGLVLGGEVYRSVEDSDIAGEFGHMTIVAGGRACACGNHGCWERYASAESAAELYAEKYTFGNSQPPLCFIDVVARADAGEQQAQETLAQVGTYLGIGIGNVICGLGVPRVVVSGQIVQGWKFIEGPARAAIARSLAGRLSRWSIEPGQSRGALSGALEVAIERYLLTLAAQPKASA